MALDALRDLLGQVEPAGWLRSLLLALAVIAALWWGGERKAKPAPLNNGKAAAAKTAAPPARGAGENGHQHRAGTEQDVDFAYSVRSGEDDCLRASDTDKIHSVASGMLDLPPAEEDVPKRTACGLVSSFSSTALTVESFGRCLQRMITNCRNARTQSRLRMFDDSTVQDAMDGMSLTLTECRCTQFRRLRAAAGLTEEQYVESMCGRPFCGGKIEASGKSRSFFMRTHDQQLVLKTIEEHEFEVLKDILPHLVLYLEQHHESLLCRFLGAYSLRIDSRTLRFVVMANVLPYHADEVYDLKGTTEDRWVNPASRGVMKDNNFAVHKMLFEVTRCNQLTLQIRDDAEFLWSLGVMDYSLLVGISPAWDCPASDAAAVAGGRGVPGKAPVTGYLGTSGSAQPAPRVFQMGIIDYLQRWTPKKVAAHWLKKATLGCYHEIDTEPPAVYHKRFYKYFYEKIQAVAH